MTTFIGKTALIHQVLAAKIPRLHATLLSPNSQLPSSTLDRRWLFTGPAGVGKSALAKTLGLQLAGHPLNLDTRMGTALNVELLRDWARNAPYRPLLSASCASPLPKGEGSGVRGNTASDSPQSCFFVKLIDELDTVPATALCELRGYLDDLPPAVIFLATTNKPVKDLAEPLQSRFQVWKFDPVQTSILADYLVAQFPQLAPNRLADIAAKAAGNVRAALADATSELDVHLFRETQPA